jgi:hypothetical protein
MKLVTYEWQGVARVGVVRGGEVVDLTDKYLSGWRPTEFGDD